MKLSVLFGVVCHYFNTKRTDMASKQRECAFIPARVIYTHILCVTCLRKEHALSALESTAMCFPRARSDPAWRSFTKRTLRLAFPGVPRHSGGYGVRKWICSAGLGTSTALSLPSPDGSSASYQGWEARAAVSSAPIEAQTRQLSDSEEVDAVSINACNRY